MRGQYKTPKGEMMQVEIFDAENKMVYVQIPNGQHKWFMESEYKNWTSTHPHVSELSLISKEYVEEFEKMYGSNNYAKETEELVSESKEVKPKKPKKNAKTNKK